MWNKPWVIVLFFVLAALLWWTFEVTRPLPGLESKGGPESWTPWLTLAGSIVSLLIGMATLALKVVELRGAKPRRRKA